MPQSHELYPPQRAVIRILYCGTKRLEDLPSLTRAGVCECAIGQDSIFGKKTRIGGEKGGQYEGVHATFSHNRPSCITAGHPPHP